jgi:hypothetical protein
MPVCFELNRNECQGYGDRLQKVTRGIAPINSNRNWKEDIAVDPLS